MQNFNGVNFLFGYVSLFQIQIKIYVKFSNYKVSISEVFDTALWILFCPKKPCWILALQFLDWKFTLAVFWNAVYI